KVSAIIGSTPRYLGLTGMAVLLFVASDAGAWRSEDFYMSAIWPPIAILVILTGFAATGITAAIRHRDWTGTAWATAAVAIILTRLGTYLLSQNAAGAILGNGLVLALAGFTVWLGYQRKSLLQVN